MIYVNTVDSSSSTSWNMSVEFYSYLTFVVNTSKFQMKKHLSLSERERHYCDEAGCLFQSVSKTSLRAHKRMEHLGEQIILSILAEEFIEISKF